MVSRKYLRSSSAGCPTGDSSLILKPAYTTNCRCTLWDIWIWHILTYLYERPSVIVRAEEARRLAARHGDGSDHIPAQMSRRSAVVNYATTIRYGQLIAVVSNCCVGAWITDQTFGASYLITLAALGFQLGTEFCFVYISLCQKFCSIATGKGC